MPLLLATLALLLQRTPLSRAQECLSPSPCIRMLEILSVRLDLQSPAGPHALTPQQPGKVFGFDPPSTPCVCPRYPVSFLPFFSQRHLILTEPERRLPSWSTPNRKMHSLQRWSNPNRKTHSSQRWSTPNRKTHSSQRWSTLNRKTHSSQRWSTLNRKTDSSQRWSTLNRKTHSQLTKLINPKQTNAQSVNKADES